MKKLILIINLILMIVAQGCQNEPGMPNSNLEKEKSHIKRIRSVEDAIEIANSSANLFFETTNSRFEKTHVASEVNVICNRHSRSSDADTLIYIVNYVDSAGFALIAADPTIDPLLAIIEDGSFSGEKTGCPGFDMYFDMALEFVNVPSDTTGRWGGEKPIIPGYPVNPPGGGGNTRDTTGLKPYVPGGDGNDPQPNPGGTPYYTRESDQITWHTKIEPKINNRWGQHSPWGDYCKNGTVGCGPLAVAMVLSYFEVPKSVSGQRYDEYRNGVSQGVDSHIFSLDWDIIKKYQTIENGHVVILNDNQSTSVAKDMMAKLGRNIGFRSNAKYDTQSNQTATTIKDNRSTLISYGLKCSDITDYNASKIENMGDGIILIRGASDTAGHEWILDGVRTYTNVHTVYYREKETDPWQVMSRQSYYSHYNHFNWGWNTAYVGWYNNNVFDSQIYVSLDEGSYASGGGESFAKDVKFIIVTK